MTERDFADLTPEEKKLVEKEAGMAFLAYRQLFEFFAAHNLKMGDVGCLALVVMAVRGLQRLAYTEGEIANLMHNASQIASAIQEGGLDPWEQGHE